MDLSIQLSSLHDMNTHKYVYGKAYAYCTFGTEGTAGLYS